MGMESMAATPVYVAGREDHDDGWDGNPFFWIVVLFLVIAFINGGIGGFGGAGAGVGSTGNFINNIVIAQAIPSTTTINAPVVITIDTGTQQYPLTRCNCAQVTACGVRTRTRYSVCVSTTATGGTFKMLGQPCCAPNNQLVSINGTAPTTPATVAASAATKA